MSKEPDRVQSLAEMNRGDVAALAGNAVLLLPIGATEQHGPALPIGTDSALVDAVIHAALKRVAPNGPTIVLAPTLPYGNSEHHLFAVAGSLRPPTLLAVLDDLLRSFVASGFGRMMIVNGHGGNHDLIRIAVQDAAVRYRAAFGACSYFTLIDEARVSAALGGAEAVELHGQAGHAGMFEASMLLASRPDLLDTDRLKEVAESLVPEDPTAHSTSLGPEVLTARYGAWPESGGFTDGAYHASVTAGHLHLEAIADRLAVIIDGFGEMRLAGRKAETDG